MSTFKDRMNDFQFEIVDPDEIEYWCKEFPSLDRQDVIDLLEACQDDADQRRLDKQKDDRYNYDTYSK
jgi:hypothetical protein